MIRSSMLIFYNNFFPVSIRLWFLNFFRVLILWSFRIFHLIQSFSLILKENRFIFHIQTLILI